jgi:SAM-dependent methyltransferase
MTCTICGNEENNKTYLLKEMMFGYKDKFEYFECAACKCFQIKDIPPDMDKYYPTNYYSLNEENGQILKTNYFKQLQYDHLSGTHKSFMGAIASFKYNPEIYNWFKSLDLKNKHVKLLDIGCGNGKLLKQLFQVGFTDLTGIDPYIKKSTVYNPHLKILKKTIFEIDEQYDTIMMHHSLEHMPEQFKIIHHLSKLLKPGGKLLIRIPVMSETLFLKYGTHLVSLDPPRHFFIHSLKSIKMLLSKAGFAVTKIEYDTKLFDVIATEQYQRDINMQDPRSYSVNKKNSVFSNKQINDFKKFCRQINEEERGLTIAVYIEKSNS